MLDATELFEFLGGDELEPDKDVIERLRFDDALNIPIELTDIDLWKNYINDDLYHLDKKVREFFKKTRWKRETKGGYKTTVPAMFMWIYGRKATPSDSGVSRILHRLLEYYCSSYTGKTSFHGKRVSRVYKFTRYATKNKRPYSLRLRLEELKDGNTANVWRANPTKDKRQQPRHKNRTDGSDAVEGRSDSVGGTES